MITLCALRACAREERGGLYALLYAPPIERVFKLFPISLSFSPLVRKKRIKRKKGE